jgi:hypothetical protein
MFLLQVQKQYRSNLCTQHGLISRPDDHACPKSMDESVQTDPILVHAAHDLLVLAKPIGVILEQLRVYNCEYPLVMDQWERLVTLAVDLQPSTESLVRRASTFQTTTAALKGCPELYPYVQQQVDRDSVYVQRQLMADLYMTFHLLDCESIYAICSGIGLDPAIISIMMELRDDDRSSSPEVCIRSSEIAMLVIGVVLLLVVGYYSYHRFRRNCRKVG